jgi:hypothetical protein
VAGQALRIRGRLDGRAEMQRAIDGAQVAGLGAGFGSTWGTNSSRGAMSATIHSDETGRGGNHQRCGGDGVFHCQQF